MDLGDDSDNNRCLIDISKVCEATQHVDALAPLYGFTGCDYSPSFHRKGKVKPMKLMAKDVKSLEAYSKVGVTDLTEEDYATFEHFVCCMYGFWKQTSVDDVIRLLFEQRSKPSASKRPLDSLKSLDPSIFPPCRRVLREHIKRMWLIARIYKAATNQYPAEEYTALDYGWQLSDDAEFLDMHWFDGEQVPNEIDEIEAENDDDNDTDNDSENDSSSDSDDQSDPEDDENE